MVLVMLLAVVASRVIASMLPVPVPLLQIALGALIHFADFTPVALDPEVFFRVAAAAIAVYRRLAYSQRRVAA